MIVAITSTGDNLEATMDARFGRCGFFCIYDTETRKSDFFVNPNKEAEGGAGPASAQFVASKGVKKVISGHFGEKVKVVFKQLNIEMVSVDVTTETIADIIAAHKL